MKSILLLVLWCATVFACTANATITEGSAPGADGVEIHYRQDGPPDPARTLLLIPGWRVSSLIWTSQLRYFAGRGDRVIAIDSRSQGAQDVSAFVNRFGTGELDDLVLVDAPVSGGPGDATGIPKYLTAILRSISLYSRNPSGYSDGMMHAIISVPTPPATMHSLVEESLETPVDVGISMLMQDLFTVDRRPYLKKFKTPTLVVASDHSPFLETQRRMAAALPMGQFVVIRHAAHAVFFDRPTAFDKAVEAFIAGGAANRGARS